MIRIETTHGDMTIELFEKDAPLTVANFLQYVDDGHFDGTIFHRVIAGFMIQGGGMDSGFGEKKTRAPIKNEADNGQQNLRGNLSMARTNAPHSATSQFFINLKDNDFLDYRPGNHGYAVFGRVTAGMEVVDAIAAVRTGTRKGHADAPLEEVLIKKASRIDPKPAPKPSPKPSK